MNKAVTCKHIVFWFTTSLLSSENCFFKRRRASARKHAEIIRRHVTRTKSFITSAPSSWGAGLKVLSQSSIPRFQANHAQHIKFTIIPTQLSALYLASLQNFFFSLLSSLIPLSSASFQAAIKLGISIEITQYLNPKSQ